MKKVEFKERSVTVVTAHSINDSDFNMKIQFRYT